MKALDKTSSIDWEFIIETIKHQKCVLFLGPDLLSLDFDNSLEEEISSFLEVETNADIKSFYPNDGLFLFSSRAKKTKTFYKLKKFYSQPSRNLNLLYEKIAQIPFHLIINLSPDLVFAETMSRIGYAHSFSYFWKNTAEAPLFTRPSRDRPAIYNLLGTIEQQESMVLSHTDLFEYLEAIFGSSTLPEILKKEIKEAHNFIFLGVPFQRWYMQLLLRILYIHNDYDFVRYAASQVSTMEIQAFCSEHFKIEFVPNRIEAFVEELFTKCEEAEILNEPSQNAIFSVENAKNLLKEDKLQMCLNLIEEHVTNSNVKDIEDSVLLLTSKFKRLRKRIMQDIISKEEADLSYNKIRFEILSLLKELEVENY
jgi:hypothetical protein